MLYDVFTLGGDSNYVTFNDESNPQYYIRAQRRAVTDRDIRQFDSNVPNGMGVVDYQTLLGKEHFVISGRIYPIGGENALYQATAALRKACNPKIAQDDPTSDQGYVLLKWTEDVGKQLRVKPLYVDIPEVINKANTPDFRILCKIRYPFIESQTLNVATTLEPQITIGAGDGGLVIPDTGVVIPDNGVVIGADSGSATNSSTNRGDYLAYPIVNIYGPITNPKITNISTGKFIAFNHTLAAGESINITIDYDGIVAQANNGNDMFQKLTAASDIDNFYLKTGANSFSLTADSLGDGCYATISFRDSWPL